MDEVSQALIHRYIKEDSAPANVEATEVADLLSAERDWHEPVSLTQRIKELRPDWQLDDLTLSIINSVDDCTRLIFRITQLSPEVNDHLRRALPGLAAAILRAPDMPLQKHPAHLVILDALSQGMVGWTPGLGASSNKLKRIFEESIDQLLEPGTDLSALEAKVMKSMTSEADKVRRLEERLAASETGLVRSKQARIFAANLINQKAKHQQVTESLTDFLRGPWYDSLQLLVNEKGIQSEAWQRADALTETLLWTYQPIDTSLPGADQQKQRLYRIVEHLPGEIRELLIALEHKLDIAETALDSLEADHVAIVSGQSLETAPFEPMETEATLTGSSVSQVLLRKVHALQPGQWFSHEEGDSLQLIKLVLKLDDVQQLLFTNRNGMKVMQKSYSDFAYDLSSHVVKTINLDAAFSSTFQTYYRGLVEELRRHRQVISERMAEVQRLDEERKRAQQKAQREAQQLAIAREEAETRRQEALKSSRLAAARAEAEKSENADRVAEFTDIVAGLASGAILYLPDADGQRQECKLAVRITAADKMIFVDRDGMKAGDYQAQQLVELLVAGEAELGDLGVEFEDTLATVVSKLRSDREKSYDDLTGS